MKKYTHAWLAMMAMKRIEKATIPDKQKPDAVTLIKWFKDYRDFVISGSWYPDAVFKDMGTSHIYKYVPDPSSKTCTFRKMPNTLRMYAEREKSDLYGKPYRIDSGNLCDRCEAFTESLIDSFKILYSESEGSPIVPSCNHIAMRFFILSHYIADCHMPLHCDKRSLSSVHAGIEEDWDEEVRQSYAIDEPNNRFFYDPEGYPLHKNVTPMIKDIEEELESREFYWAWGPDCGNTWEYMDGISEYSYLMAERLVPRSLGDEKTLTKEAYRASDVYKEHFQEYSKIILMDAIESIAKVWLHAWVRYRVWWRTCEETRMKAENDKAESNLNKAKAIIKDHPVLILEQSSKIAENQAKLDEKVADLAEKDGTANPEKKGTAKQIAAAQKAVEKAQAKLDESVEKLDTLQKELDNAKASEEGLLYLSVAAQIQYDQLLQDHAKYAKEG